MKKRRKRSERKAKKYWLTLLFVPVIILLMYILMLPDGAVRFAVLKSGHPFTAFSTGIEEMGNQYELEDGQIGYMLTEPPYDRERGETMRYWVVSRHGIAYVGEYYEP